VTSGWQQPRFWAWLALASLPVSLLAWRMNWSLVDPAYLGLSLAWAPVDALARLMALRCLLDPGARGLPWGRFASSLSAEIRVGLGSFNRVLAGLIPAFFVLSLKGFQSRAWLGFGLVLALLGALPGLFYALKRILAPIYVLRGARAYDALAASAQALDGRLLRFLRVFLPWTLAAWALQGLALALPDPWASGMDIVAGALELLALALGSSAL
jgi:hypothetical protein